MYLPDFNQHYHRIVQIRYYLLMYYTSNLVNCLLDKLIPQTYIHIYDIGLKRKNTSSPQLFKLCKYRKPPISFFCPQSQRGGRTLSTHRALHTAELKPLLRERFCFSSHPLVNRSSRTTSDVTTQVTAAGCCTRGKWARN